MFGWFIKCHLVINGNDLSVNGDFGEAFARKNICVLAV